MSQKDRLPNDTERYPKRLPREQRYRHTNQRFLRHPLDLIHGFVETDYSKGMHVQEFVEINIITKGQGMHYLENRRLPAVRGDVFIIPPEMSHGYVGTEGFDVYHFLISNQFMEKNMTDLKLLPAFFTLFHAEPLMRSADAEPLHLRLTDEQLEQIEPLLEQVKLYTARKTPADGIICNSLAMMLITSLCEIYLTNQSNPADGEIQDDEAFLNALAMIHERYDEKISIAQLARVAQLSRSAFLRRFQQVCQMPPAKYLTKRRIEAAEHMLANTGLPVSEIAVQTGFYDTSHFIRTFLSEKGTTPGAYRNQCQKDALLPNAHM